MIDDAWRNVLISQLSGSFVAFFGYIFHAGEARTAKRILSGLVLVISFFSAFILLVVHLYSRSVFSGSREILTVWFLYGDVFLLSILVISSGGVTQSMFTPLFLLIPTAAITFVPLTSFYQNKHIWGIAGLVVIIYAVLYSCSDFFQDFFFKKDDQNSKPTEIEAKGVHSWGVVGVLAGSVGLTVFMGTMWGKP